MKLVREKERKWRKRKTDKVLRSRWRRSHRGHRNSRKIKLAGQSLQKNKRTAKKRNRLIAPLVFCLVDNTNEVLKFFESAHKKIEECGVNEKVFIDTFHVETVSADAIMYLIALIKNVRRVKGLGIKFEGNMPQCETARNFIIQAGFYGYVQPRREEKRPKVSASKQIQIQNGKDSDPELAGQICNFVNRFGESGMTATKRLYATIMELMLNTRQHAYKESGKMIDNWYIYAENTEEYVQFVFLDTGEGIPRTVSKKLTESMQDRFKNNDAKYIKSALLGDFRTETKKPNRGLGLPSIFEDALKGNLFDVHVISNKGKCSIQGEEIHETILSATLTGTLFSWKFPTRKQGGQYEKVI